MFSVINTYLLLKSSVLVQKFFNPRKSMECRDLKYSMITSDRFNEWNIFLMQINLQYIFSGD